MNCLWWSLRAWLLDSAGAGKEAFPDVRLTEIGRLTEPGTSSTALPRGFDHFFGSQEL